MEKHSTLTDSELLTLLKAGGHTAFNEIHHRHFATLYRAAYNVLRDRDACMDIVQEVFVWFWEHREQHAMNSIKGYLLMAVKYQVANYIRSGKVKAAFFDRLAAIKIVTLDETSLEVNELKAIIKKFTEQLPERCGEVFRLSREEYLSNKEIAAQMNISEKTVEAQITQALKKLRTHLGKMNFWFIFL